MVYFGLRKFLSVFDEYNVIVYVFYFDDFFYKVWFWGIFVFDCFYYFIVVFFRGSNDGVGGGSSIIFFFWFF